MVPAGRRVQPGAIRKDCIKVDYIKVHGVGDLRLGRDQQELTTRHRPSHTRPRALIRIRRVADSVREPLVRDGAAIGHRYGSMFRSCIDAHLAWEVNERALRYKRRDLR